MVIYPYVLTSTIFVLKVKSFLFLPITFRELLLHHLRKCIQFLFKLNTLLRNNSLQDFKTFKMNSQKKIVCALNLTAIFSLVPIVCYCNVTINNLPILYYNNANNDTAKL